MAFTFDATAKLITLSTGTTSFDLADLWSDWPCRLQVTSTRCAGSRAKPRANILLRLTIWSAR